MELVKCLSTAIQTVVLDLPVFNLETVSKFLIERFTTSAVGKSALTELLRLKQEMGVTAAQL